MIYFTSDLHFNHDRKFIYEPRGFKTIKKMNDTFVRNWNSVISDEDDVYVLGDFFLGADEKFVKKVLSKLNGSIHLILGNHDTPQKVELYKTCSNIVNYVPGLSTGFPTSDDLVYNNRRFRLSHYPTLTSELTGDPDTAVFNLFGHTHSKDKFYEDRPYMYNVAVDAHCGYPVSIVEVMSDIDREIQKCISFLV